MSNSYLSKSQVISQVTTNTVLAPHEPDAFQCLQHELNSPIVFCCDHASKRIPESLDNLGLDEEYLSSHIAWDIGAAELTKRIAKHFSATALLNNYSRLVVDCNRYLSDPTAFSQVSDCITIPGNQNLHELDKANRVEAIYYRYHRAIRTELESRTSTEQTPILISIHSFTPQLRGQEKRDLHAGVLWDKDGRIPLALLDALREGSNLTIGDNEPYSGRSIADYTIDHHAEAKGIAHTSLEIRQDLLSTESGLQEWTQRLCNAFEKVFQNKNIFQPLV